MNVEILLVVSGSNPFLATLFSPTPTPAYFMHTWKLFPVVVGLEEVNHGARPNHMCLGKRITMTPL